MTLPSSNLSLARIAQELGRSLPISLTDSWIRALAQVPSGAISISNLFGKSGRWDNVCATVGDSSGASVFPNDGIPIWGTTIASINQFPSPETDVSFNSAPYWTGNFRLYNNTTGASILLTKLSSTQWSAAANNGVLRPGFTDSFTLLPA